ncbi:hypothetical protein P7K49_032884 [Saguinus oedipus]|uniref:Uncharacterized protein n=1 Tax=Saguinus oedipus TaxID=9490 RepID=A0ABQ9TS17_SAGOE|nr:hypothetical protein P7K49_032884 [Saguinus oedipus]
MHWNEKPGDRIKDSFHSSRDSVPSLQGEGASRAQTLDKATEDVQYLRRENHTRQQDSDDLERREALLEQQVRALEEARPSAQLQTNHPAQMAASRSTPRAAPPLPSMGAQSSSGWRPGQP